MIQKESQTDWQEMYKVFNMGHRMEIYLPAEFAEEVIDFKQLWSGCPNHRKGRICRPSTGHHRWRKRGIHLPLENFRFFFILSIRIIIFALRSLNIGEVPEWPKGLVC